MSRAAEDRVAAVTDPRIGDVARALLTAIARLIPEGDTTTPLIGMGALGRLARIDRRTVWTWIPILVEIGEVRIVDGGQGRPARYMLVHVDGAPPITAAPLPLVGATPRPRVKTRPAADDTTGDLFAPPIVRSNSEELVIGPITRITRITSWLRRTITRITSWRPLVRKESEELVIGTCDPCDPTSSDLIHARDVHTFKNVHTHAPAGEPPKRETQKPPPCRYAGTVHAWCDGRVHVPMDLHREFLRKLGGTTADADLRAFYAERCAALDPAHPIGENDFQFWRRAFKARFSHSQPAPRGDSTSTPTPSADELAEARREIERRLGRDWRKLG